MFTKHTYLLLFLRPDLLQVDVHFASHKNFTEIYSAHLPICKILIFIFGAYVSNELHFPFPFDGIWSANSANHLESIRFSGQELKVLFIHLAVCRLNTNHQSFIQDTLFYDQDLFKAIRLFKIRTCTDLI